MCGCLWVAGQCCSWTFSLRYIVTKVYKWLFLENPANLLCCTSIKHNKRTERAPPKKAKGLERDRQSRIKSQKTNGDDGQRLA